MDWKAGDWVVFDMSVGQIKEIRKGKAASFSDGWFETFGMLADRFRPLTLKNKQIVEWFETVYDRLHEIDGEAEFNYPRISQYFSELALKAIDAPDDEKAKQFYDKASDFVREARDHKSIIQDIPLFRPQLRKRASNR